MNATRVTCSDNLSTACDSFLLEIEDWVQSCRSKYGELPPSDVHDQATYTTSWASYIEKSGDQQTLHFLKKIRDQISKHFTDNGAWYHGYWKKQEIHHGTEHFELFLGTLYHLDPTDSKTCEHILNATEHICNLSPEIPDWFDWSNGLFRSIYLGTEHIDLSPPARINMPDHFRCANLSRLAYEISGDPVYKSLIETALLPWARAITEYAELPVSLSTNGPIFSLDEDQDAAYRRFAGEAPALKEQATRAENLLASDAVTSLLTAWKYSDKEVFLNAARRIIQILSSQIEDPDAGAAIDAIRNYRRATGDKSYDKMIINEAHNCDRHICRTLSIYPEPVKKVKEVGIGKRTDQPDWFEDGQPRKVNPILLGFAAEINRDEHMARQAVDLASAYFRLARAVYPDGRQHGCSARSVSAVARGHGRDNHAGMITAVLDPIMSSFIKSD